MCVSGEWAFALCVVMGKRHGHHNNKNKNSNNKKRSKPLVDLKDYEPLITPSLTYTLSFPLPTTHHHQEGEQKGQKGRKEEEKENEEEEKEEEYGEQGPLHSPNAAALVKEAKDYSALRSDNHAGEMCDGDAQQKSPALVVASNESDYRVPNSGDVTCSSSEESKDDDERKSALGVFPFDLMISDKAFRQLPHGMLVDGIEKLLEAKFKIMSARVQYGIEIWTLAAQIINPYEVVRCFAAPVLNRAFFKMWELLQTFPLASPSNYSFRSAHLCEAPGAFIQALLTHRAQRGGRDVRLEGGEECKDSWFSMSLSKSAIEEDALTAQMGEIEKACGIQVEGHVHYGADESGDITDPLNISAFVDYVLTNTQGKRLHLVTGDGAFDASDDFSSQEQTHARLIFCQIVTALRLQETGGSLVLKIFDCFTEATATMVSILLSLYESVEIARLRTSRVCNSERYIVARGFHGLPHESEEYLMDLVEVWREFELQGIDVAIISSVGLPPGLLDSLVDSNSRIAQLEVESIEQALSVAEDIGARLSFMNVQDAKLDVVSILRRKMKSLEKMKSNAYSLCKDLSIPM